ncbi:MAG: hypothetical protein QM750_18205 [Rubrivivax sp.]
MPSRPFPRTAAVLTLAGCLALPALAFDFSKTPPVAEIGDGQVSVGVRTVKLPPGNWTFVAYAQNRYMVGGSTASPRHTGYFANVADHRFRVGLAIEMGEIAVASSRWTDDPCKIDGNVHKAALDATPLFPECLVINQRPSLHKSQTPGFYKPVGDWLAQQGLEQSIQVMDLMFLHTSSTGQGTVRLFFPATAFASKQAAIEWAQALPPLFRPFFQGRVNEVTLPALP